MNELVIYNSKTGFTKRYANWISEELKCECISLKNIGSVDLKRFDTIIFASFIYAGTISKLKWYKNLTIKNKVVFAVGASDIGEYENIINNNFKDDYQDYQLFYAQSGLCYEKMGFIDKNILKTVNNMNKKKFGEDSIEYTKMSKSFDVCSKQAINPLITYIKSIKI